MQLSRVEQQNTAKQSSSPSNKWNLILMTLHGCSVLIVEDEPLVAFDYADELAERGAQTHVAGSLEEAVSAVSSNLPDLAVLDVNLGHELVWPVAETLSEHRVPFLLVTGSRTDDLPARVRPVVCLEKPMAAYVIADRLTELARRQPS
jgi:DNA-binding response OmpR family regulator